MNTGNGSLVAALERLAATEADQLDLRQLFMSEMRALRGDLKAIAEQGRDTGRAVDLILAELRLRDKQEEEDDAGL